MPVYGEMQLVLYCREKFFGRYGINRVVHGSRIDIRDFLIKLTLACPYLTNFVKQMLEIFFVENLSVFQAFLVQHVSLHRKRAEHRSRPLPKLRGANGIDSLPHGNDCIKIIEFH